MDNDFDSVSWQNESDNNIAHAGAPPDSANDGFTSTASGKRKASNSSQQAGQTADAVDLAGIGDGRLDCTVDMPIKENDGTKDAYVSYLVTTEVIDPSLLHEKWLMEDDRPTSRHSRSR